ncbi:MAG TPA: ABC transporter substrate-binding protein [Dehalococcoidia bacterium]|nr:ABC transporter substrate-binding protein [Dehalococcoidia bacterium]
MYRFFSHRFGAASAALLALALATLLLVACGDDDGNSEAAGASSGGSGTATFPRTITDSSNTKVTIPAQPKRIISLSPAATEILFAVGAGDRVVGSDKFSNYPEAALKTAKLDYSKPDPEAALALNPDLVIMATRQEEQVKQFRDLKMTVLYFEEAATVDGVYDSITLLGQLTGHDDQAAQLVTSMRQRVTAMTSKVADVTKGPRVFYELTTDLYTASPDTFIGSMLSLLKAQNVAAGAASEFPQLTAEAVIAADPEVILLADAEFQAQNADTVLTRPGWANVSAVKNRRVFGIDDDLASRPGPRIVEAMEIVAKALYPDRFR